MRYVIILSLIFCSISQATNEIRAFSPGISTAYYVVREIDGDVWYVTGQVFEIWGTGARTATDYDIALVDKTGGMFVGNMDTNISSGQYYIVTHYQAGGSPADTDPAVWVEYGDWDGSSWIPSTITAADVADAVWDEAMAGHTTETTFGGELQTLDPNITLILADTNEIQTDQVDGGRLDVIWDAIKYKTDLITLVDTVVKDANDANNFTIEDGTDVNDAYWFMAIIVEDAGGNQSKEIRWIDRYDENSGDPNVWVDEPFSFTPAQNDVVHVMGTCYGGYLDLIYDNIRHSRSVINFIDATGDSARRRTETIWKDDEDNGLVPGI